MHIIAPPQTFDAIVVGSGVSGGYAAKELTEKGLRVLMLDRGKPLEHVTGYESAMKDPWEMPHRGKLTNEQIKAHPYLSRDTIFQEANAQYWINDTDSPYTETKRFDWFRPDIVGGKSIMWGRQTYRWSDLDFEANAKEGIAVDWPIRYKDIAPWYSYVEKFVGISGEKLNLPQLPDSDFMPAMQMNCLEKHVASAIKSTYKGDRVMTIGRVANLTNAQKLHTDLGRASCQFRNLCSRGCPFGGYFSTQAATLPAAQKTGRLTLRPHSIVAEVLYDEQKGRAKGVRVIDSQTGESMEFFAKLVFVNGSTLGTTFVLLNSISKRFPNGLGNDSGVLGQNLMDHHFRVGASGTYDGFQDSYYYGRRANGIYVPRYRNIGNDKRDYLRGFGYQGRAARTRNEGAEGFGADMKEKMTQPGEWTMGLGGFGECLPYASNQVTLDRTKTDKWGLPTMVFNAEFRENEKKMQIDMMNDAAEMLEAAGLKNIRAYNNQSAPGMAIHEMGTARMGRDPKTSILNGWNQMHTVKNVFVTDGASMTSSSCVNPSLTYMALTARAVDYAVREMKKNNL
ncbi:GMC family oxidoreductase [Rudanella paleaurantiibacter]|uniref:GMC family oxidoreductase n=1 Tax=Rudanella paleaurantiibacter TaxID=2614655 RepID=A0A7J5U504_9BACT|nr:GMC family oxidoreductase [Rudanella paleaurantiibacter]KAB7732741.1 GMC family oxidoreductase [Rudanella paleaurantiibacter]